MSIKQRAEWCPDCGWKTRVWVEAAPGPSDWICRVCEFEAQVELYKESRDKFHDLLITAFEKLIYMGYPIEDFPGMEPHLLEKAWEQTRDHESFS